MAERTKKKPDSPVKLVVVLFLITAISALLLGFVNANTKDIIAAHKAEKTAAAMQAVLPAESYTPMPYAGGETLVTAVYEAAGGGWVIEVTPNGFGGAIDMLVGIKDGKVTGTEIVSMTETSGLGAEAGSESFRSQYLGGGGPFALTKSGGTIEALSGATVTSRAFTAGVNAALAAASEMGGEG